MTRPVYLVVTAMTTMLVCAMGGSAGLLGEGLAGVEPIGGCYLSLGRS